MGIVEGVIIKWALGGAPQALPYPLSDALGASRQNLNDDIMRKL